MPVELKVPELGESISNVQIGEWLKKEGDYVDRDETVAALETDKTAIELPSPIGAILSKIVKKVGERCQVGEVIAILEPSAKPAAAAKPATTPSRPAAAPKPASKPAPTPAKATSSQTKVMPAARRLLAENNLRAEEVKASGPAGRLLKEDVARHVDAASSAGEESVVDETLEIADDFRQEQVVPMSPLRLRIAERLVQAKQQAALLTTFNEVDMSAVTSLRAEHKAAFEEKHGVKLGFMSFFVKAVCDALKAIPQVNAEIRGADIVYRDYCDIGVAVGGGKGLVVPVLRNAERLSFGQIEKTIARLATKAKENKLTLEELEGGTFTISNGGVYGSMLSTPIVNPPQTAILGLHAIQDRPVARDGAVVIRPMMYLALTYDHRLVDGREAVTFLRRIKDVVENPARLLLEV